MPESSVEKTTSASSDAESRSQGSDSRDVPSEDGWEETPDDEEEVRILCFFSDEQCSDVRSLLDHCKQTHNWDIARHCRDLALDFYGAVRLVNYIRSRFQKDEAIAELPSKEVFEDEKYLQPVLEDDALLISLEEILELAEGQSTDGGREGTSEHTRVLLGRISNPEEELQRLQSQFMSYKLAVKGVLDERLEAQTASLDSAPPDIDAKPPTKVSEQATKDDEHNDDSSYFDSYSYNDIHEIMLKDTVRTDAYRDFIYDNKNIFAGKTVLDVGCGTGILSMFCAKAGARKVIAVDNSSIIDKARENVFANGLGNVISCLRGKIEEVTLPVKQVDIIISEWMGYCLLYEAMLDSVIWARDRYLAPDGLMVPSHITLHLAPVSDPDYIASHIAFWHSVYGFSMTSMLESIYDHIVIRHLPAATIASSSAPFLQLPLHTVTREDLTFTTNFEVTLHQDIDTLDAWAIWFDTFFTPSRSDTITTTTTTTPNRAGPHHMVSFTTGPFGPETHWRQGLLLIDHGRCSSSSPSSASSTPLKKHQTIRGQIAYRKPPSNPRELDVEISWCEDDGEHHGAANGGGGGSVDAAVVRVEEKAMENPRKKKKKEKKQIWFMR